MKDLILKHRLTDRGGNNHYEIYEMPEGIEFLLRPENKLGELTFEPDGLDKATHKTTGNERDSGSYQGTAVDCPTAETCDDCGTEFIPDDTTFMGDWDDPEGECSPFTQLTYLCAKCFAKRTSQ